MGLLRNLAHTIFGFLILTALWITALSFLSMRPTATAVITDLGVDALNPFLVSKGIGLSPTTYSKLQAVAGAVPDNALPITFIKPPVKGSEIKNLPYDQGVRLIYSRMADAYYDGGPSAALSLPGPIAGAVQSFALFPEQYDTAVKAAPLPSWLQPFLLFTGLSPETLTATGHARIEGLLPKFWTAAALFAGAILLLNLLGRRNPIQSLGLALWHGAWPTVAFFAVLTVIGRLYPDRVHPVAAAFAVVAGAFLPIYAVAAAIGLGAWLISKFAGALFKGVQKSAARKPAPAVQQHYRGGYSDHPDDTPAYIPTVPTAAPPQPRPQYGQSAGGQYGQSAGQQGQGWQPSSPQPPRQSWNQPAGPNWGSTAPQEPGQPSWNQPRPWDAPTQAGQQDDQGQSRGSNRPLGPDDPTPPRW